MQTQLFKAAFFRALAHPVRVRILVLGIGEHSVQELPQALGLEQPLVSHLFDPTELTRQMTAGTAH